MISYDEVVFSYNSKPFLENINVEFKSGKITTILGPNGCGKSTLLKLGAKILKPNSGVIKYDNTALDNISEKEFAKKVAVLFQENQAPHITVEQLVLCGRYPYHSFLDSSYNKNDLSIAEDAMKMAQCYDLKDKLVNRLSGGERRRAYIAMALAQSTDIIFLDEPTTYLDINVSFEIMDLISLLNSKYGKTIVMVIHDINFAFRFSDEIVVMDKGHILCCDSSENVIESGIIDDVFKINTKIFKKDNVSYYCFEK